MKKTLQIIQSLLWAFLLTMWAIAPIVIAGVTVQVRKISDQATIYFIEGICVAIFLNVTVLCIKLFSKNKILFAWKKRQFQSWMYIILLAEAIPFISGIQQGVNVLQWSALCFFMLMVGMFEEIVFRKVIRSHFERYSIKVAIIVSTLFFGLGHASNLLSGKNIGATTHQIIFALLFGLATVLIVYKLNSLVFGMIWHALHNIIITVTGGTQTPLQLGALAVQMGLLILLIIILLKDVRNQYAHSKGVI